MQSGTMRPRPDKRYQHPPRHEGRGFSGQRGHFRFPLQRRPGGRHPRAWTPCSDEECRSRNYGRHAGGYGRSNNGTSLGSCGFHCQRFRRLATRTPLERNEREDLPGQQQIPNKPVRGRKHTQPGAVGCKVVCLPAVAPGNTLEWYDAIAAISNPAGPDHIRRPGLTTGDCPACARCGRTWA